MIWKLFFLVGFSGSRFVSTDPPTSIVRLGSSLNASNIKEGDDVYFECQVQSNPPPNRIIWKKDVSSGLIFDSFAWNRYDINLSFLFQIMHFLLKPLYPSSLLFWFQGKEVRYSPSGGIIRSNHSLVLQKVSKQSAGAYTCQAVNSEGSGASKPVKLDIKCKWTLQKISNFMKWRNAVITLVIFEATLMLDYGGNPSSSLQWNFQEKLGKLQEGNKCISKCCNQWNCNLFQHKAFVLCGFCSNLIIHYGSNVTTLSPLRLTVRNANVLTVELLLEWNRGTW